MPKRDMQSIWSLLSDLARELSWLLRIGFFGGLLIGAGLAFYLVSQIPIAEIRRGFLRILLVFVLGSTAVGGFLGLALGVVAELLVHRVGSKDKPTQKRSRNTGASR